MAATRVPKALQRTDTEIYNKFSGGDIVLTDLRQTIADEMMDEILQCSLEDFQRHYAPWQVPVATVDGVYDLYVADEEHGSPLVKQVEQGDRASVESSWVFTNFETEPTIAKSTESVIFKELEAIVNLLCASRVEEKLRKTNRVATLCYKDCPDKKIKGEIEGTNIWVDAYLTERLDGQSEDADYRVPGPCVDLADIAVVAEFKKHLKDRIQNRRQLIADASQILNNDPRRTWMYGFTIENTMMSVWYFSRSHTVVSAPFDFTKDIKSFIHVFLSLLYATREEIGYDPTVHRVLHEEKIQYVYKIASEVETRYFRTTKKLFTSRVLCIKGRKTRVWKAVEVEGYKGEQYRKEKEGGREVALKDCWLDEGSKTEKDNMDGIFNALDEVKKKVKQDSKVLDWADSTGNRQLFEELLNTGDYKRYFMKIKCDMKLAITKSRLPSAEPVPKFLEPMLGTTSSTFRSILTQAAQGTQTFPEMVYQRHIPAQARPRPPREHRAKRNYRLVYEEVGQPLYAAPDLQSSLHALADVLTALTLLYLAGYVHRDVSTGNIILIQGSDGISRGKLSDLEYAKVFQDGELSPDPKTGTPFFMACEILSGNVFYSPPPVVNRNFNSQTGHAVSPATSTRLMRPKFRFTHDLESLLWVALYIFAKYLPQDERSRKFVDDVYVPASSPSQARTDMIKMEPKGCQVYLESCLHSTIACFATYLAHYQSVLGLSYMDKSHVDRMLDHTSYALLYEITHEAFSGIKEVFDSGKVPNFKFTHDVGAQQDSLPPESQRKRPRAQGEGEDDDYVAIEQDLLPDRQLARKRPKRGKM